MKAARYSPKVFIFCKNRSVYLYYNLLKKFISAPILFVRVELRNQLTFILLLCCYIWPARFSYVIKFLFLKGAYLNTILLITNIRQIKSEGEMNVYN